MIDSIGDIQLQRICDVLADTSSGLTGSEIGKLLSDLAIADLLPAMTKRHRLYEALRGRQQQDRCGNLIVEFIHRAMDPVRYTGNSSYYETKRQELNEVLAFCGLTLGDDGKLRRQQPARTLTEAEERAGRLRSELQRRGVHIWPARRPLAACRAALIATLLPDPGSPEKRQELCEKIAGKVIHTLEKKKMPNGQIVERIKEETEGGILHWGRETENADTLEWFRQEIRKA